MLIVGIFQRGVRFDQAYGEIGGGECPHRWLAHAKREGLLYISASKMNQYVGNVEIYTYILGTSMYIYTMYIYTMYTYYLYIYDLYIYSTYVFQVLCTQILGVDDFWCWHHPSTIHLFWPANCRPWMMTPRSWRIFFGWIGYFLWQQFVLYSFFVKICVPITCLPQTSRALSWRCHFVFLTNTWTIFESFQSDLMSRDKTKIWPLKF